jgi:adenosylcobinamide kinase / adenosylcobinamide-phosphate guanylyltransferase
MANNLGLQPAHSELILGGQRSGKSRRAEALTAAWLGQSRDHRAVFVVTAHAGDDEMRKRIARHQADRAQRLPGVMTVEEPLALADAIRQHSAPGTLLVVDCLTLWLTNLRMPLDFESNTALAPVDTAQAAMLLGAIENTAGPMILVSNEIGLGVIPLGPPVRAFVDALGRLNQQVAQRCHRVTLMVAGLPLMIKDAAWP